MVELVGRFLKHLVNKHILKLKNLTLEEKVIFEREVS